MGGNNVDSSLKCSHKEDSGVCVGVCAGFKPFVGTKYHHNNSNA